MNMPLGTLDRRPPPFFKQGPSALTRMLFYSALSVVLMVADTHFRLTGPVRSAISVVLYPVEQFTLAPVRWARSFNGYLDGLKSAQAQRDAAQRQLVAQARDVLRMTQLEQENAQLRQLLGLRPRLRVSARAAEVLYETTDPYSERIVIDRGSTQGVRLGSPVIDDHGVLGQVTRVYPLTAEVTLLTDKDAAIPVINGRTKERVIAFGKPDARAMELRFLSSNADVRVGDVLTTSGLDGIYLPGLPVATVSRVDLRTDTAFAHIVAQPAARLRGESHVLVMDPVAAQLPAPSPTAEPAQITPVLNWSPASAPLADDAPVPTREVRHPPKGRKHP